MSYYDFAVITLSFIGILAYLNNRFIQLPTTIVVMAGSLAISIIIQVINYYGYEFIYDVVYSSLLNFDFHQLLMDGFLSFLLFAGAINFNIKDLEECKWEIITTSTLSVIGNICLIGVLLYYTSNLLGLKLDFIYCLLFGSLIAPTDPMAVLSIFSKINAPRQMQIVISGESLFNDAFSIVFFITCYHIAVSQIEITAEQIITIMTRQIIGGSIYGIILGLLGRQLILPLKHFKSEVLLTLAIAAGGYAFAEYLQLSGPLSMVITGIIIGSAMHPSESHHTCSFTNLKNFWEIIDELLNSILFFLIGLEILVISHKHLNWSIAVLAIIIVLFSRVLCVGIPIELFKRFKPYPKHMTKIIIWSGLRGGLAVALALSLPHGEQRELILTMTYSVVLFSTFAQGLSLPWLVKLAKPLSLHL